MRISPSPTMVLVTFLCANPVAEFHGDQYGLPLRDASQVGLLEPRIWATEREKFEKQSRRVNDAVSEAAKRTLPALGRGKRTNDFFKKATLEEKSNDEISELLDIQDFENMWLSLGRARCFTGAKPEEADVVCKLGFVLVFRKRHAEPSPGQPNTKDCPLSMAWAQL